MRPLERQSRIIDTVRAQGKAAVDELADMFGTSVETIRRDLTALARKNAKLGLVFLDMKRTAAELARRL